MASVGVRVATFSPALRMPSTSRLPCSITSSAINSALTVSSTTSKGIRRLFWPGDPSGSEYVSGINSVNSGATNNVIVENQSINDEGDGGGIAVVGSSPVIAWNVIVRNTATRNGGGIGAPRIGRHHFEVNAFRGRHLVTTFLLSEFKPFR